MVVRQKREILSWQIPLVVNSMYFDDLAYNKTSQTLCSINYNQSGLEEEKEFITVSLSTANYQNILFKLNMTKQYDFYIRYVIQISYILLHLEFHWYFTLRFHFPSGLEEKETYKFHHLNLFIMVILSQGKRKVLL